MIYKDMFERLPDRFRKTNTEKMYEVLFSSYDDISGTMKDIKDSRDIDKAFGQTLDYLAWNVGVLRINEDDDLFRLLIKINIIANLSRGDIETINEVAKVLIGDGFQGIRETWNLNKYSNEPAGLVLEMKNQAILFRSNAVDRTIAGGVGIRYVLELIQEKPSIYLAMTTLGGEDITVYPYHIKDLESKGIVYIPIGNRAEVDTTTILPKGDD